ncbi:hypothetical protein [Actinoallomurus acanthiterrae]
MGQVVVADGVDPFEQPISVLVAKVRMCWTVALSSGQAARICLSSKAMSACR